jgi:hypothetical protein
MKTQCIGKGEFRVKIMSSARRERIRKIDGVTVLEDGRVIFRKPELTQVLREATR